MAKFRPLNASFPPLFKEDYSINFEDVRLGVDGFQQIARNTNFAKKLLSVVDSHRDSSTDVARQAVYDSVVALPICVDDRNLLFQSLQKCFPVSSIDFIESVATSTALYVEDTEPTPRMIGMVNEKLGFRWRKPRRGLADSFSSMQAYWKGKFGAKEDDENPLDRLVQETMLPFRDRMRDIDEPDNAGAITQEWNVLYLCAELCLSDLDWRNSQSPTTLDNLNSNTSAIIQSITSTNLMLCGKYDDASLVGDLESRHSNLKPESMMLFELTARTVEAFNGKLSEEDITSSLSTWFKTDNQPDSCLSDLLFYRLIGYWPDLWVEDFFDACYESNQLNDGFLSALCLCVYENAITRNDGNICSSALNRWNQIDYTPDKGEDWITIQMANVRSRADG